MHPALNPGDQLGPYRITGRIGMGGMGEVFKAHDSRLGRDVAIKVSAQQFSERFDREARVIAALNHSNICTLHDVGSNFLVMELVEGESPKGPMPFEEALRIIRQIADALEAAHEKGVIHRDLKPANIKIRPDGTVKVLDFGLAKVGWTGTRGSDTDLTLEGGVTEAGVILGTPAYMAPEQANGKEVDKRADIWAFGVVLYELLTGKLPFTGDNVGDVLASVLKTEPQWDDVPVKAQKLLRRCLEKEPRHRLRDIGDAWELLSDELPPARTLTPIQNWLWIAAAFALIVALALWALWRPAIPSAQPVVRLDVDLGPDVSLGSEAGPDVIISPDGSRIVYVSQARLFTRRLDQPGDIELAGTDGAFAPFFSPSGQWVAFFSGSKLKKVSVEGGATVTLCDAPSGRGGAWSEDGSIIASLNTTGGLSSIPETGGMPTPATYLANGETTHRWPQILPGEKDVLFSASSFGGVWESATIELWSLKDGQRTTLQRNGFYGRYLPTGHLVWMSKGTLFGASFDVALRKITGAPAPLIPAVKNGPLFGSAQIDFARNGTVVYRGGSAGGGQSTVQWLDAKGNTEPLLAKPGFYTYPHLSRDSKRLALTINDGAVRDIFIYDVARQTTLGRTFSGTAVSATWSPDGEYFVFTTGKGISWARADGVGKSQSLTESQNSQLPHSFTPDGKRLAYWEGSPDTASNLWTVPIESGATGLRAGKPEPFLQTPADERLPAFSHNGRWVAYTSNESPPLQVYVRAFPDNGGVWQVSTAGGADPVWSKDDRSLFFRSSDNRIMVATYTVKGDSFAVDPPRRWSEKLVANIGVFGLFDLAQDGRVVALIPEEEGRQSKVTFVLNFFDEVRRRIPKGK